MSSHVRKNRQTLHKSKDRKNVNQVEIVTYIVSDDEKKKYIVEDFAPDSYYDTGLLASIPVYHAVGDLVLK